MISANIVKRDAATILLYLVCVSHHLLMILPYIKVHYTGSSAGGEGQIRQVIASNPYLYIKKRLPNKIQQKDKNNLSFR